jgi:hypothetical protein
MKCISEPVSWLRLERYALGESKDHEERSAVAAHLAVCEACRLCFETIEVDSKAELRPLSPVRSLRARRDSLARAGVAIGAGLALAAAAVIGVGRWTGRPGDRGPGVKGDAVAFSLVRDDELLIAEAGGTFREHDRFKALVTCPPGMRARFEVVVWDKAGATFPLDVPPDLACGNDVPIPGAFRVTGTESVRVCLVWDEAAIDRQMLSRVADDAALSRAVCKVLQPAP